MRRYIITLFVLALLIGSLFKGADQTGVRLLKMFGTFGIFLFGVVGTLALTRWQSREGTKQVETALKSLEPDFLITDWAGQGKGRPDYLLVGPGGVVAVCIDDTPQSQGKKRAEASLGRARERVEASVNWLRDRLAQVAPQLAAPTEGQAREMPVAAMLVLTRRQAEDEYPAGGVTVVNADRLAEQVRSLWDRTLLEEAARIKLTRSIRQA